MAKRSNRIQSLLAGVPALAGAAAALVSVAVTSREAYSKIEDFLSSPINTVTVVVYGSTILTITTIIIFQLARSTRAADREELDREPLPLRTPAQERPKTEQSADEVAKRERNRYAMEIRFVFARTRRRLIAEAERNQRNAFLNLTIGVLFSVIALGVLGYPLVYASDLQVAEWISLFERFAPRFSVGILIQIIGFFFLRLYVAAENEVHYIRNEITNFESRLISYDAAMVAEDALAVRDIIKQLVRTERNFKLKTGERGLYSTDETYNDMRQLLKDAAGAMQTSAKNA
jgi:hypothetical protein